MLLHNLPGHINCSRLKYFGFVDVYMLIRNGLALPLDICHGLSCVLQMPYEISFRWNDAEAMSEPRTNVSYVGYVPRMETVFRWGGTRDVISERACGITGKWKRWRLEMASEESKYDLSNLHIEVVIKKPVYCLMRRSKIIITSMRR